MANEQREENPMWVLEDFGGRQDNNLWTVQRLPKNIQETCSLLLYLPVIAIQIQGKFLVRELMERDVNGWPKTGYFSEEYRNFPKLTSARTAKESHEQRDAHARAYWAARARENNLTPLEKQNRDWLNHQLANGIRG
ncbi:hypothetical protein EON65_58445 [archaeon]|nr:MAG: hypothetical protein EON65_58445 [archaeon]